MSQRYKLNSYFCFMEPIFTDEYFMKKALVEAENAFEKGEIPVGAIIVVENRVIARSHNLTEMLNDVTAHAEMQAITAAAHFFFSELEKKRKVRKRKRTGFFEQFQFWNFE